MKKLTFLYLLLCTSCIVSIQRGRYTYSNRWEISPKANLKIHVKKKELIDFYVFNESQKSKLTVKIMGIENIVMPLDSLKKDKISAGTIIILNENNSSTNVRIRLEKLTRKVKINEGNLTY